MSISSRLMELQEDIRAEDLDATINFPSLSSFLHFIELIRADVEENLILSLTPENEIYMTWKGSNKHCLHFREDGTIRYFVM